MAITRRAVLAGAAAATGAAAGYVDPREFGARFDGVTDDTAAWQKAVDRAIATGQPLIARGGVSRLVCRPQPIGTYGNSTVRVYRAVDIRGSNLTMVGEGAEIRLTGHGASNAANYAFATAKTVRRGALRNIKVRGLKFDFNPAGDPSINKRSFHLVGVDGVELNDLVLRSSGKRAGATITLQNCRGVRMSRLRFVNVTQGMNLSYVDDVVGSDWTFDNFSEAVDFDRMVSQFRLTNLSFSGGGPANQCLDLNSCSDGVISGVTARNVGNIAIVNYKPTTPPTYAEYVSNPGYNGPPFQPSRDVTIERVRGERIGAHGGQTAFTLGGEARAASQNGFPNARISLRDVRLTNSAGALMIEQVKDFLLEDVSLDGAAIPGAGFGAIDVRARRAGSQVSGTMRRVKLRFTGQAGSGLRAAGAAALTLDGVEVTGPSSPKIAHFEFPSLDTNAARISLNRTTARANGGGGGVAYKFADSGKGGYGIDWGAGNQHLGAFAPQAVVQNGQSRRLTRGR